MFDATTGKYFETASTGSAYCVESCTLTHIPIAVAGNAHTLECLESIYLFILLAAVHRIVLVVLFL